MFQAKGVVTGIVSKDVRVGNSKCMVKGELDHRGKDAVVFM